MPEGIFVKKSFQTQYQRELERLEKENKMLKQRLLLSDKGEQRRLKKLKVCIYLRELNILKNIYA